MSLKAAFAGALPPGVRHYSARIEASPLAARLVQGAFWSVAGAVIARFLSLAASIFAARMLGVQGFGEMGAMQSTAGMVGVLAGCGLGLTATKYVAEFRKSDPARTGRIIGLCYLITFMAGIIGTLALVGLAPWLARETLAAPQLDSLLRSSAGLSLLGALTGVQAGILGGFEAFKPLARVNLASGLLAFPMLIGGAHWGGVQGAVWALTANLAVNALLNHVAVRATARSHDVPISFSGALEEMGILGRFSIFALLGSLMGVPINWACNAILLNQPDGYAQMGIFNAANQWRMIILFLPAAIGSVALPMMASLHGEGDRVRHSKVLRCTLLLNGGVALLLALPLMALARPVLACYGPGFVSGQFAFVLLTLAAVVLAVNNGVSRAIASTGAMRLDLSLHVIWGATFLSASWLLIPRFGVTGLAAATILGAVLQGLCQWGWLLRSHRGPCRHATNPSCALASNEPPLHNRELSQRQQLSGGSAPSAGSVGRKTPRDPVDSTSISHMAEHGSTTPEPPNADKPAVGVALLPDNAYLTTQRSVP